jgi:hypothetical protein
MNKGKNRPEELDETTLEQEELSTHQETVPVPYVAGTQLIALRWISPALDMVTKQAAQEYSKK